MTCVLCFQGTAAPNPALTRKADRLRHYLTNLQNAIDKILTHTGLTSDDEVINAFDELFYCFVTLCCYLNFVKGNLNVYRMGQKYFFESPQKHVSVMYFYFTNFRSLRSPSGLVRIEIKCLLDRMYPLWQECSFTS